MHADEQTDPGVHGWRIKQLEERAEDHEARLRLLERSQLRLAGAAAAGSAVGGVLLQLALHFLTR